MPYCHSNTHAGRANPGASKVTGWRSSETPCDMQAVSNTTTRLYFRMGVQGPRAPEKPYSVGVRGAAKPPLAPPPWMKSGGRSPPDLLTLVVVLIPPDSDCLGFLMRRARANTFRISDEAASVAYFRAPTLKDCRQEPPLEI